MRDFDEEDKVIIERLRRELTGQLALLGKGLPARLHESLPGARLLETFRPGQMESSELLIAVEAKEVSVAGDLVAARDDDMPSAVNGRRVIVATRHNHSDGVPKLLDSCRSKVTCRGCVEKVITELGVVEIKAEGLVLTEIAPGVAADEVKIRTGASLHIADDIQVMQLWD